MHPTWNRKSQSQFAIANVVGHDGLGLETLTNVNVDRSHDAVGEPKLGRGVEATGGRDQNE
jgi:hypothetical protein